MSQVSIPRLYSLRCCPYAMRARLGIFLSKQPVYLRDIVLKNIPKQMTDISPTNTVPLLVFDNEQIIDESLDIMLWALTNNDPLNLLISDNVNQQKLMMTLINQHDEVFIPWLEKYKKACRYHLETEQEVRGKCEEFLNVLNLKLAENVYLMGPNPCLADYALMPFIRQLSRVDRKWYLNSPFTQVRRWLDEHYQNPLFTKVMKKHPRWLDSGEEFLMSNQ